MRRVAPLLVTLALAAPACIDPLVEDTLVRDDLFLPAGAAVPLLADDTLALAAMAAGMPEEVRGLVSARHAFAGGASVVWWDLGPASPTPVAAYLLVRQAADGDLRADGRRFSAIDHPLVLTAIPSDLGYSPLVRLVLVPVTGAYAGELLTSVDAVEAARLAGLVEAPREIPYVRDSPVVLPTSRLEPAPGEAAVAPEVAFHGGRVVHVLTFATWFSPGTHVPVSRQYVLRREGGEVISEVVRAVDLTGDGDTNDTNDLFAHAPDDVGYSPLVRPVEVVVAAELRGIDSYSSSALSDLMDAAELFDAEGALDPSVVRGLRTEDVIVNRPFAILAPEEP